MIALYRDPKGEKIFDKVRPTAPQTTDTATTQMIQDNNNNCS